jgi:type VI secretion system secreted protein Hcp
MTKKDIFLLLESTRTGLVCGEVSDPVHDGEMAVEDWSWGMSSGSAMGDGKAARTALSELRVVRWVDAASTALMSVMRNNELIKRAVLTVRKAGGTAPIDYFVLTIERGRITSYEVSTNDDPGTLRESLTIAFEKIEIQHSKQSSKGAKQAASLFSADLGGKA